MMLRIEHDSLLVRVSLLVSVTVLVFLFFFWTDLELTRQSLRDLEKARVVSTVRSYLPALGDAVFFGFDKPVNEIGKRLVRDRNGILEVVITRDGKTLYRFESGASLFGKGDETERFALNKGGERLGEVTIRYKPVYTDIYFKKYRETVFIAAFGLLLLWVLSFRYLYYKIAALTRLADSLRGMDPLRTQVLPVEEGYYEIRNITDALSRLLSKITERTADLRSVNIQLRENERRLVTAQRIAKMSSWTFWPQNGRLSVSGEFYRIFEINRKKVKHVTPAFVLRAIHPVDRRLFLRMMEEAIENGRSFEMTHRIITTKGKVRYIRTEGRVRRSSSKATEVMGISMDVTEETEAKRQAEHMAYYDPLTGLLNRRAFMERLQQAIVRADMEKRRLGVVFVDLDNFKFINDSYGHPAGDGLLRRVAGVLQETVRPCDVVGRFGGDEFVLMINDLIAPEDLKGISSKILLALNRSFEVDGHVFMVSASVGVALYPDDAKSADMLLRYADAAMYEAKKAGKNRHRFFDHYIKERIEEQAQMLEEIKTALRKENEIVLFYQPQIDLRSNRVRGAEVLTRWRHPRRGLLYPSSFIPLIESGPLIVEYDDYVMRMAFRRLHEWHSMGMRDWRIGINLSAGQFNDSRLIEKMQKLLRLYPVDPGNVEIEVTESLPMQDMATAVTVLKNIKQLGFKVSIDDFGTGYSSLSYLRQLPFDVIKIDREFIRDMHETEDDITIVKLMIQIAKALDKEVVAEGADRTEHIQILKALSCDYVQGFYYAEAMEGDAFLRFAEAFYASD